MSLWRMIQVLRGKTSELETLREENEELRTERDKARRLRRKAEVRHLARAREAGDAAELRFEAVLKQAATGEKT